MVSGRTMASNSSAVTAPERLPPDGWLTSAAFFDLENDGDLDLFACGYVAWTAEFDRAQDFQLTGTGQGRAYGKSGKQPRVGA